MKLHPALSAALTLFAAACSAREAAEATGPVREGYVALAATDEISRDTVERIAASQSLPPRQALDRAVSDAIFAAEGRKRIHPARVTVAERRALARTFLEDTWAEARRKGPPTDDEVAAETARRWWEVDRPELRRTTHAIVLLHVGADEGRALAFARRVASAVEGASDAAAFRALAGPLREPGFDFRVEDLEPVAATGYAVEPTRAPPPGSTLTTYDPAYVAATFKIPAIGRKSPVVKTSFGFHVILLTEVLPEYRVPLEERRKLFEEQIVLGRAGRLRDAALEHARSADRVEVQRSAAELTEKVNVSL